MATLADLQKRYGAYQETPGMQGNITNINRMSAGLENRGLDRNVLNQYVTTQNEQTFGDIDSILKRFQSSRRQRGLPETGSLGDAQGLIESRLALGAEQNQKMAQAAQQLNEQVRQQNLQTAAGLQQNLLGVQAQREGNINQYNQGLQNLALQQQIANLERSKMKWGLLGSLFQGVGGLGGAALTGGLSMLGNSGGDAVGSLSSGTSMGTPPGGSEYALYPR